MSYKGKFFLLLMTLVLCGINFGCDKCEGLVTNVYFEPVFSTRAEIRESLEVLPGREITSRGKIFFKDGYLFINEPKNGIHIVDNRDPLNPQNIAFINVPGSFDIAVKDDVLMTDSYMDLVMLDISDLNAIEEINRLENYFQAHAPAGMWYDHWEEGIAVDWVEKETTTEVSSCGMSGVNVWARGSWGLELLNSDIMANTALDAGSAPSSPGIAGSMARFALNGNFLYMLDGGNLKNLDLTNLDEPTAGTELYLGWDVETLFPRGEELFVGASGGMHILDISNRSVPERLSTYEHVRSCDPVIVEGDLAFVTLRSGTPCQGFTNQLEVIDISNLRSPRLLHTYQMSNPHGLSKDGDVLFICDGDAGLKAFDASDISRIGQNLLMHDSNIQAYDIIAFNNVAMLIGDDGLHQYDYSDINNIRYLSTIRILP